MSYDFSPDRLRYGQTAQHNRDGTVTISGPCTVTGKTHSITVNADGFTDWQHGRLIQQALPSVSADDREFLISGTSPEGWKQLFPFGDDEPEDAGYEFPPAAFPPDDTPASSEVPDDGLTF